MNSSITRWIFGILFLCVLGYIAFVFRFYIQSPSITIDQMDYIVTNNPIVTISGETKNIHTLYINSVPTLLNDEGKFTQTRGITTGVTTITISGIDRFDRTVDKTISVERQEVFIPPTPSPEENIDEELDDSENTEELEKLTD